MSYPINYSKISKPSQRSQRHKEQQSRKYLSQQSSSNYIESSQKNRNSYKSYKNDQNKELKNKLISFEMQLLNKMNTLRRQKIQLLQKYNHQFEQNLNLSKILSTYQNKDLQNTEQSKNRINQQYLIDQFDKDISFHKQFLSNKQEQKELNQILTSIYELEDIIKYQQTRLNLKQFQNFDYIMKHYKFTTKYINSGQISVDLMFQTQNQNQFSQIMILQDLIKNNLNQKLTNLQYQVRTKHSKQIQTLQEVKLTLNKKSLLQKQILKVNQVLNRIIQQTQVIQVNNLSHNKIKQKEKQLIMILNTKISQKKEYLRKQQTNKLILFEQFQKITNNLKQLKNQNKIITKILKQIN